MPFSVLGLARSGVAAANALVARGESVIISDLKDGEALAEHLAKLHPDVQVRFGENVVRQGDTVVVSPGLPPSAPVFAEARKRRHEVIGEIALFQRLADGVDTLAVTGTDGKSTTTTWLGEMVAADGQPCWVGGNLGTPLCAALSELTHKHVVVAEVSCFQLWTSREWHPKVAVITNIAPDHLDYYDGSYDAYKAAKRLVLGNLRSDDTAVLNADDETLAEWRAPRGAQTWWFSRTALTGGKSGVYLDEAGYLVWRHYGRDVRLVHRSELRVPGLHNVENAMAAAAGALAYGVSMISVQAALRSFSGLEHRIELVSEVDGVRWYNDSKATNPHAGEAALRAFDEKIVLIAGGYEKDSDFTVWADLAVERCAHVVLNGNTAERMAEALGDRVPVTRVETLAQAIDAAKGLATPDSVVVLSPVCSSFDQFKSFEHRGAAFKEIVTAL